MSSSSSKSHERKNHLQDNMKLWTIYTLFQQLKMVCFKFTCQIGFAFKESKYKKMVHSLQSCSDLGKRYSNMHCSFYKLRYN